jgi:hypothetical protein
MTTETVQQTDGDVACVRCGYNLRGLAADGACPECSAPIAGSLVENRLLGADQRWLRTVHHGLSLLLMRYIVSLIPTLAFVLGWMAEWSRFATVAVYIAVLGLALLGLVLVSAPNPAVPRRSGSIAGRSLVCLAAVIQLLTFVAQSPSARGWYRGTAVPRPWPARC